MVSLSQGAAGGGGGGGAGLSCLPPAVVLLAVVVGGSRGCCDCGGRAEGRISPLVRKFFLFGILGQLQSLELGYELFARHHVRSHALSVALEIEQVPVLDPGVVGGAQSHSSRELPADDHRHCHVQHERCSEDEFEEEQREGGGSVVLVAWLVPVERDEGGNPLAEGSNPLAVPASLASGRFVLVVVTHRAAGKRRPLLELLLSLVAVESARLGDVVESAELEPHVLEDQAVVVVELEILFFLKNTKMHNWYYKWRFGEGEEGGGRRSRVYSESLS